MKAKKYEKLSEKDKELIEQNLPFIYGYMYRKELFDEDEQQQVMIEICKRISEYDENKSSITTFLAVIINSGAKKVYQHNSTKKELTERMAKSLEESPFQDKNKESNNNQQLCVLTGAVDYNFEIIEDKILYDEIMNEVINSKNISKKEKHALFTYINSRTLLEASKKEKCSKQNIDQTIRRTINKIKEMDVVNIYE